VTSVWGIRSTIAAHNNSFDHGIGPLGDLYSDAAGGKSHDLECGGLPIGTRQRENSLLDQLLCVFGNTSWRARQ